MAKDLKYFMRSIEPETVTAPAPESFKDEKGNVIQLEIKVLTQEEIDRIQNAYRKRGIATDKKGNPLVSNGEVIWKTEKDSNRAAQHMVAEALVYPNLKDKELMDYYKCVDISEMPLKVFSKPGEYIQVLHAVLEACGLAATTAGEEDDLEAAKNS